MGALLLAFAVWMRGSRPRAAVSVAAPRAAGFAGRCAFAPGDVRAFAVERRVTQGAAVVSALRATLVVRAEDVDPAGVATLTAVLTGVTVEDPALRDAAVRPLPFAVKLAPDCRFEAFGFAPATPPATARALRATLRTFEVVVPTGAPARTWIAVHRDDGADVRVRYALEAGDAGARLTRRRERITLRERVEGLAPAVLASDGRWSLAPDGRWLDTFADDERVRLSPRAGSEADLVSRVALTRVPGAWPALALPPGWPAGADYREPASGVDPARLAVDDPALGLDFDGATARLRTLYDARRNAAATEALNFLVSWLEAHPEGAAAILRALRAGSYPEDLAPVTFFAMSQARDPRVRDALTAALEDTDLPAPQRFRATVALGDSVSADPSTVAALTRVHASRRPGDDVRTEAVTDGALNAVGTLASRATGETAAAAHASLRAALDGARTPEDRVDALDAAGNSHDARYRGDAETALGDASARVRGSAARALGAMRDAGAEAALRERLAAESDPEVLRAVIAAIRAATRRPAGETVAVAAGRLPRIDDAPTRVALVELLGAASDTSREARAALRAWYPQERDGRVLAAIGRFLRADELGG